LATKIKDLEIKKEEKIWAANKSREYQLQNINNIFEAEKKQAEDEYDLEKQQLREQMIVTLQEKQKKLEEEKNTMNLTDGNDSRSMPRNLRRRGKETTTTIKEPAYNRSSKLNPPRIVYLLKETEIQEDLMLISKSYTGGRYLREKIYENRGVLHYHDKTFEKGSTIIIETENKDAKERLVGTITSITSQEIQVKGLDNTKSRFLLAQVRAGKHIVLTP